MYIYIYVYVYTYIISKLTSCESPHRLASEDCCFFGIYRLI